MIQTVIFDLGGVIVPLDFAAGYKQLEGRCPYTAEEIPERIRSTDAVVRFESGKVSPEHFYRELAAVLQLDASYDEFKALWCAIFPEQALFPHEWIEQIRREKRVLLLSNTNAIHFAMIRQTYPLLRHFDDYVLSHEVGALKPSPLMYEAAIARARCEPGECFFIDDIPAYVAGAQAAGIDAVQFQSEAQLKTELASRGIRWE